jgi:hypothetical protein
MTILSHHEVNATTTATKPAHLANENSIPSFALKPARHHRQFLFDEESQCESLKGHDHTKPASSDYSSSSSSSSEKVSTVKQRGGGSWLLGLARLRDNEDEVTSTLPGLVRSNSSSSLESTSTDDDASTITSMKKKGVSFNESVVAHSIPHASTYTPAQRRRMYTTSMDVRQNKIRNKKEYRYDGYDWRNCTEEWEMSVCMVTGELVHPVHAL